MPNRSSNDSKDENELAKSIVDQATSDSEDNGAAMDKETVSRVMSEMGRKGGRKGGKARMASLSDEEKTALALKAAKARWGKENRKKESSEPLD